MSNALTFALLIGGALLLLPRSQGGNNNPLNIKYDPVNQWVGQRGFDSRGFVVFENDLYSLRAGFKLLKTYASKGVVTLEQIIERYAPPFKIVNGVKVPENDTKNYINFVIKRLGIMPSQPVPESRWPELIQAIAKMEKGVEIPMTKIIAARNIV